MAFNLTDQDFNDTVREIDHYQFDPNIINPILEADLYIHYEKYDAAKEILMNGLETHPELTSLIFHEIARINDLMFSLNHIQSSGTLSISNFLKKKEVFYWNCHVLIARGSSKISSKIKICLNHKYCGSELEEKILIKLDDFLKEIPYSLVSFEEYHA